MHTKPEREHRHRALWVMAAMWACVGLIIVGQAVLA